MKESEIKAYLVDVRPPDTASGPYDEPLIVTADATGSFDSDGTIVSYTFDFDDGTVLGPQRAPYATHTLMAGTRDVTVTVEDDMGATHVTVQSITVQGVDRAPVVTANPTVSVAANGSLSLVVAVTDPNNDAITALTADLSGLPTGHGAVFTPAPDSEAGTFTWNPTVGDVGGPYEVTFSASNTLQGDAVSAITVTDANQIPEAVLALLPEYGFAPMSLTADASASFDPDGNIVSYTFSFGDGMEIGPQETPVATHTLAEGNYLISVLAEDDLGATSIANKPAHVLTNVIANSSFESSLEGWKENGGASVQFNADGLDGTMALEMTGPAATSSFGINDSPNWIDLVSGAGHTYHFSAWVRSDSGNGSAVIKIREYLDGVKQGATHDSDPVPLSPAWQEVSTDYVVRVNGSTLDMSVLDEPVTANEVFEVDLVRAGEVTSSPTVAVDDASPARFSARVSPNPVLDRGRLHFTTTRSGPLRVAVFDANGRRVLKLLDDAAAPAGRHVLSFSPRGHDGIPLQPGVYFYRVQAGEEAASGRFLILR